MVKRHTARYLPIFVCILLFAFISRLCIAVNYFNTFDTFWYLDWAEKLQDGFFSCYQHIDTLDYPPVFLYPLYLIGKIFNVFSIRESFLFQPASMFVMKFFPIMFDILSAMLLSRFATKYNSERAGLFAACLYLFNPAVIFNSAYWGQTDSILMFLLLMTFFYFDMRKPVMGCIWFAITCLTKLQGLFFAPLILMFLFIRFPLRKAIGALGAGLLTGVLIFLPFMPASGVLIPFRVIFGGFGLYPYATLKAYNLYGIFNLDWVKDSMSLIPALRGSGSFFEVLTSYYTISMIFMAAGFVFIFYLCIRKKADIWMLSFLQMQFLFLFTTRMHERYQIIILPLLLILLVKLPDIRLFAIFVLQSLIVFLNQYFVLTTILTDVPEAVWRPVYTVSQTIGSVFNICIFVYTVFIVYQLLGKKNSLKACSFFPCCYPAAGTCAVTFKGMK